MGLSFSFNHGRMFLLTGNKAAWSRPSHNLKDEKKSEQEKPINLLQNTEVKDETMRESVSTKNLPTDTLLANKGINITTENKIEQPFQGFSDEADSTLQEIKLTNTEKEIESPFNLFG